MENRHIAFSPPDITEEEIAEVADTLRSGYSMCRDEFTCSWNWSGG